MLKNDSEVTKTCQNVRKIPFYAKRCVEILNEMRKTTGEKEYTESAFRMVATGQWSNQRIFEIFLILIQQHIDETKEISQKAELLNKQFESLTA